MPDRIRTARSTALCVTAAALLLAAGCGSDQGDADQRPAGVPVDTDQSSGPSGAVDARPDMAAVLLEVHPERADAVGEPPAGLGVVDLRAGEGPAAQAGDALLVQYHGVRWSDGGTFDTSWDRGRPFGFVLGSGQVIVGWDQGLLGMQVGGRRVLTIPSSAAYGDGGVGDIIAPGETLVFVIDLIDLTSTERS